LEKFAVEKFFQKILNLQLKFTILGKVMGKFEILSMLCLSEICSCLSQNCNFLSSTF